MFSTMRQVTPIWFIAAIATILLGACRGKSASEKLEQIAGTYPTPLANAVAQLTAPTQPEAAPPPPISINKIKNDYPIALCGAFDTICGYVHANGNIAIAPRFDKAFDFDSNGLALAMHNCKWGFINPEGKWVIPPQLDWAWSFTENGLALAAQNGKWGFIDTQGQWVIPPQFINQALQPQLWEFSKNERARIYIDGKYGFIDINGKLVIPAQFDNAHDFDDDGLARVQIDKKWGFIDANGRWVIEPKFHSVKKFNQYGVAHAQPHYGYTVLINKKGQLVKPTPAHADPKINYKGSALYRKEGVNKKYGYVNAVDQWVISPKFDYAYEFAANNVARVEVKELEPPAPDIFTRLTCDTQYNTFTGYINTKGEWVVPPVFGFEYIRADDFSANGLALVEHPNKGEDTLHFEGFINAQGKWVIPPQDNISFEKFSEIGWARVSKSAQGSNGVQYEYGFIDTHGNWIIGPNPSPLFLTQRKVSYAKKSELGFGNNQVTRLVSQGNRHQRLVNLSGTTLIRFATENDKTVLKNKAGRIIWRQAKTTNPTCQPPPSVY